MKQLIALLLFVPSLCLTQVPTYVPTDGLIAWYPLNGDANDVSGNDLDLSLNGQVSHQDQSENPNQALLFSGQPIIATQSELNLTGYVSFTISVWLMRTSNDEFYAIMGNSEGPGETNKGLLQFGWGQPNTYSWHVNAPDQPGFGNFSSGFSPAMDEWHHITYVKDSLDYAIYINGEASGAGSYLYEQNLASSSTFIGNAQDCCNLGFHGAMDNLGLWSRALDCTEVMSLFIEALPNAGCTDQEACNFQPDANVDDGSCIYPEPTYDCDGNVELPPHVPGEGLVAWYPFNGTAADESGYGNSVEVFGATLTEDRFGNPNGAYFFDGDDHMISPHQPWLNGGTGARTFSGWFRQTEVVDYAHMITKGQFPLDDKLYLRIYSDGYTFSENSEFDNLAANGVSCPSPLDASWNHLVGIKDTAEGTMSIYLNGVFMCSDAIDSPEYSPDNEAPLTLGVASADIPLPSGPQYFVGDLDELGIWNRALNEAEVQALFLGAPPESGCLDSAACNFDSAATADDGSCEYGCLYCGEGTVWDSALAQCISTADTIYIEPAACAPSCGPGTVWDPVNEECIIAIPADLNYDGCVSVNDLLVLLAVHGTCPPYPEWPEEPADTSDCPPGAFDQLQQDLNGAGWSWLGEYNTAQYFVSTNPISWDNAQSSAVAYGGHLVVIESQDENDWISTAVGDEYIWIGLYQDTSSVEYSEPAGGWTWVNGAELTYTNWAGNAPNEVNGLENACQMYSSGQWNDAPGDYFLDGSDGRDIYAVIEFSSACPTPDWTCGDPLTYWDYDYATALIGDQCWFAENLRTASYLNGDDIPEPSNQDEWATLLLGMSTVYGSDEHTCYSAWNFDACDDSLALGEYGRLYNWWAVDDSRGLCPLEWHVASNQEWFELENHAAQNGFNGMEATALQSTSGWGVTGNGTDDFGFAAKPAGHCDFGGTFFYAGNRGKWWTSTYENGNGRYWYSTHMDPEIHSAVDTPKYGFSVRCIKD